jgi:two-component system sensor histidine kinase YesM
VSDDGLLSCDMPKILLQPIIENSIQYGFNNRRSGGAIDLQALQEQGKLHIIIEDNGVGMDMGKVQQSMVHQAATKKGYALYNIVNRLNLYYGDAASIELFSSPGRGSRTDLWIPMRKGDGGSHG